MLACVPRKPSTGLDVPEWHVFDMKCHRNVQATLEPAAISGCYPLMDCCSPVLKYNPIWGGGVPSGVWNFRGWGGNQWNQGGMWLVG